MLPLNKKYPKTPYYIKRIFKNFIKIPFNTPNKVIDELLGGIDRILTSKIRKEWQRTQFKNLETIYSAFNNFWDFNKKKKTFILWKI